MLKRVAIMLFCLMMVFIATFGFVVGVVAVPTIYSYAAVNDDPIYVPLRDPSDAVTAFQAYCKSRDLTIEGSLADAVTTFTTGAFNSACNEIGINISQLQAELKAEYDQSGKPVKFLLNDTGVMAMNRIFAQFLQDNELQVGDTDVDQTVYDGQLFVDANGVSCLAYVINTSSTTNFDKSKIEQKGTFYGYSLPYIKSQATASVPFEFTVYPNNLNSSVTYTFYYRKNSTAEQIVNTAYGGYNYEIYYKRVDGGQSEYIGEPCVFYNKYDNHTYVGTCEVSVYGSNATFKVVNSTRVTNVSPATVVIVATTINNNTYEGDTIINNEGDVIVEPDPVPPGGTDPGWDIGGGGGTATDGNGNTWNIQFPDFELPDLNIDWSINGLGEKFPFSIPFDLVALVTVLNAEPQAPRFEGTVNFGFTTWDYDINLQQFYMLEQRYRIAED